MWTATEGDGERDGGEQDEGGQLGEGLLIHLQVG